MFKNYLKIAFRNLWKNRVYSAINIFGLSVGLATCLLITLFVINELSYDRYNENARRIFRINADFRVNGSVFNQRLTPAAMAQALVNDYPQIEKAVRIRDEGKMLVRKGSETFVEARCVYADSTLFDVFTFSMISGDPRTALVSPHSMVISESIARKYFNSTDVIGKTLLVNNSTSYIITGVIEDMPAQSHVHFDFIKAMSELEDSRGTNWMTVNFVTYVLTRPGVDTKMLDGFLAQSTRRYAENQLKQFINSSLDDLEQKGDHFRFVSIPLTDIHLHSTLTDEMEPSGNIQYVYICIVIAVFILLVACINFMNLSTARSSGRAREVGIRKVMGSLRSGLIVQFLLESVLMTAIALVLALAIALLLLPYFNRLADTQITLDLLSVKWIIPFLLGTTLVVGLLAGSYPAFLLSSFQPVHVLKGKLAAGFKGSWLRNVLVVFQYAIAIVLIVSTLIIYSQLNYIRNKKLGYDREQVLVLHNLASLGSKAQTFKNEVLQLRSIKTATMTHFLPTAGIEETRVYSRDAGASAGQSVALDTWTIDDDYIPTLGMEMAAGRNFSANMPTDSSALIINESAAALLGYSDPVNKKLYQNVPYTIIGIVKDFHAGSLRNKIKPLVFRLGEQRGSMAMRIETTNIPVLISALKNKYYSMGGMDGQPFVYTFMDDDFNRLYHAEQNSGRIFFSFAFFAILIACLGLFGLMTYAVEQRSREIGIRKVLGADAQSIIRILCGDFLKLVLIALLISVPLTWWGMSKWLQDFAYRTNIQWWTFVVAALLALVITAFTIGYQVIKAALISPARTLRAE